MPIHPSRLQCVWITALWLWLAGTSCESTSDRPIVTIFHAASLSGVLAQVEEQLEERHPGLDIRLEPSGSQVAARKVTELHRRADLVLSADHRILESMLLPTHAKWVIRFAANEIVLAHGEHSRHTETITKDNWHRLLLEPEVRLGRADENTAPLGFHTLLVWQLAQLQLGPAEAGGELAKRLRDRCPKERVTPDVAELISLLESRTIDYAFVFRSIAEEHNLKITPLPPSYNLGDPANEAGYARARVELTLRSGARTETIPGAPILYGLSIPDAAPNKAWAERVAHFLLSPEGAKILTRSGFKPLDPAGCDRPEHLPRDLAARVAGERGP